jgi:hypothetical protein
MNNRRQHDAARKTFTSVKQEIGPLSVTLAHIPRSSMRKRVALAAVIYGKRSPRKRGAEEKKCEGF